MGFSIQGHPRVGEAAVKEMVGAQVQAAEEAELRRASGRSTGRGEEAERQRGKERRLMS